MGERDHLDNAVSSDLGEYMGIRRWANIALKSSIVHGEMWS